MTIRSAVADLVRDVLIHRYPDAAGIDFEVGKPPEKELGDFATNVALLVAKKLGLNPMEAAAEIASRIELRSDLIKSAKVAKPGFINIVITHETFLAKIREIVQAKDDRCFGGADIGKGKMIQVEFVSANPTGPLNVVSARAAAVGDALVKLLRRVGYQVQSEFYINDCGTQVALLGESLCARFMEAIGRCAQIPDQGYPGEYLIDIARLVLDIAKVAGDVDMAFASMDLAKGDSWLDDIVKTIANAPDQYENLSLSVFESFLRKINSQMVKNIGSLYACYLSSQPVDSERMRRELLCLKQATSASKRESVGGDKPQWGSELVFIGEAYPGWHFDFGKFAVEEIVKGQKKSLERFGKEEGIRFDCWFRESLLREEVFQFANSLIEDGRFVVEKEGALWLKGGDRSESDEWVIRRSNGEPTYFLSDIVYHINKRKRGFEKVIDIWGPDHHGHIKRMEAAMKIVSEIYPQLGISPDWLKVLIVQQVNLVRDGKRVQMSKRAGEYITLDELTDEVGADVAKFFFLMRRCNSHLDFDLDLAKLTSEENPVYYVQYAHARICSILEYASRRGYDISALGDADLGKLTTSEEIELLRLSADFDDLIIASALSLEPHRLTSYLTDLASAFHKFYHNHRVVTDDAETTKARLCLCIAVRTVIRSGLWLLGISAPQSM